jgi:hypothetical protein
MLWRMHYPITMHPPLTRRPDRDPDRSGGWLIYCGDVRVGHIGKQAGVPLHGDQWGWNCGFQPGCDPGEQKSGTGSSYEDAKAQFQKAWERLAAKKTEAHFEVWRRSRDFHAWKNRMHDEAKPLPTQRTDGRAHCFCGAEITNASLDRHINEAHRGIGYT